MQLRKPQLLACTRIPGFDPFGCREAASKPIWGPGRNQLAVVDRTVVVAPMLVGIGEFTTHSSFPVLVVGLGCSLGVRFGF